MELAGEGAGASETPPGVFSVEFAEGEEVSALVWAVEEEQEAPEVELTKEGAGDR